MATPQQLQELVNAMLTLQHRVTASEAVAEVSRQRQTAAEAQLYHQASSRPQHTLVDTRSFGRVASFSGARADWSDWKFQFCAFMAGANPNVAEQLVWAEAQKSHIDEDTIDLRGQDVKAISVQLYLALSLQVRNEALTNGPER